MKQGKVGLGMIVIGGDEFIIEVDPFVY